MVDSSTLGFWVSFIPGLAALVVAIVGVMRWGGERRKLKDEIKKLQAETGSANADVAKKIQEAASGLLDEYKEQVDNLRGEVGELLDRVRTLEKELGCVRNEKADLQQKLAGKGMELGRLERVLDGVKAGAWVLFHQVTRLGAEPEYEPPVEREKSEGGWRRIS